jgi:hypothetical protein
MLRSNGWFKRFRPYGGFALPLSLIQNSAPYAIDLPALKDSS